MTSINGDTGRDNIVPLGAEMEPQSPDVVTPPGRLHGLAIGGMALSALTGIVSMFLFITVNWPGNLARYVVAVFLFSMIGFIGSAAAAIFTAARDTYAGRPR
jgi:hypothetical protein